MLQIWTVDFTPQPCVKQRLPWSMKDGRKPLRSKRTHEVLTPSKAGVIAVIDCGTNCKNIFK